MRHAIWSAAAVVLAGSLGSAQQDASARLQRMPGAARTLHLDLATGQRSALTGNAAFLGVDVVYNNTCDTGFFAALSPSDVFLDNGQISGSTNTQLPGLDDIVLVDGFEFAYCTDQASVDLVLTFHTLHANCTDITGVPGSGFVLSGLPGSASGLACWTLVVDLAGTSLVLTYNADGDGLYNGVPAQDTHGYTFECTNITGTVGIVLAGNPIFLNQGCDFAVGTIYEVADPTGAAPQGTGYGSTDSFGLMQSGAYAGCFFFGGWPGNPWSSYWMRMYSSSTNPCFTTCILATTCYGDGSAVPCPCGNGTSAFAQEGCLHSGGQGAKLTYFAGSASVTAADLQLEIYQLPVGNGGIFLASSVLGGGVAVFDGIACVGGGLRLGAGFETSPGRRVSGDDGALGPSLITEGNTVSPGFFAFGQYHFQYWTRDVAAGPSPCGSAANFSPAGTISLTP